MREMQSFEKSVNSAITRFSQGPRETPQVAVEGELELGVGTQTALAAGRSTPLDTVDHADCEEAKVLNAGVSCFSEVSDPEENSMSVYMGELEENLLVKDDLGKSGSGDSSHKCRLPGQENVDAQLDVL